MEVVLGAIGSSLRKAQDDVSFAVTREYIRRTEQYEACSLRFFPHEAGMLEAVDRRAGRSSTTLLLFDGRGKMFRSAEFAAKLGQIRDGGCQQLMLAVGPASGWSKETLERAALVISLGQITLPHALALAVIAEQTYRAFTILAGHPYHCGH